MRYGLIADIHSRWANLERILEHMKNFPVDAICCLGDVFEVKVPKRDIPGFCYTQLEQVVDLDDRFLPFFTRIPTVIGNQEERILALIPPHSLPEKLGRILTHMPLEIILSDQAMMLHGHQLHWEDYGTDGEYYYPVIVNWQRPRIFYGHNHQNALFQVTEPEGSQPAVVRRISIPIGQPIPLEQGVRYLINVGDIKKQHPSWVLYDDTRDELVYYTL